MGFDLKSKLGINSSFLILFAPYGPVFKGAKSFISCATKTPSHSHDEIKKRFDSVGI
jgi:hypothetical protein